MTGFRFRLEQVLAWRRTQLETEESRLRQSLAEVAAIDRGRAELEAAGVRVDVEVRQWSPIEGRDLQALSRFRQHLHNQEKQIAARRAVAVQSLERQRQVMLEARRRCRLIERLRERRLAEWEAAADREIEQLAAECHLSGLARRLSSQP